VPSHDVAGSLATHLQRSFDLFDLACPRLFLVICFILIENLTSPRVGTEIVLIVCVTEPNHTDSVKFLRLRIIRFLKNDDVEPTEAVFLRYVLAVVPSLEPRTGEKLKTLEFVDSVGAQSRGLEPDLGVKGIIGGIYDAAGGRTESVRAVGNARFRELRDLFRCQGPAIVEDQICDDSRREYTYRSVQVAASEDRIYDSP
jgi:hypothetical protein